MLIFIEDIIALKNSENEHFYAGAALESNLPQPTLDKYFDSLNWPVLLRQAEVNNNGQDPRAQFIVGYENGKLNARIEIYPNDRLRFLGKEEVTPEKAFELLIRLSEFYDIYDVNLDVLLPKGFDSYKILDTIAFNLPNLISWFFDKIKMYKNLNVSILNYLNAILNPKILKNMIENEDVIHLIGKKEINRLREKVMTLQPEIYKDLQKELSVLTDIEIRDNKKFYDEVLLNILEEYVDIYGRYNVMQEIKNRYKNHEFIEKRNWKILKTIDGTKLAHEIQKRTFSIKGFLKLFDLFLRIASKNVVDDDDLLIKCNDAFITQEKILDGCHVYLPGLEKLETEIVNISLNKWIQEKLPTINQFM